jgi:PilZ domain-containing protein
MAFRFIPHASVKSPSQLALLTCWDKLAAGRRLPAFAELKLEPGLHDPKQLVAWNIEGEGRLQKFRAVYQGEGIADVFNTAWAGKTMEQVVPMSLRRLTLDAAKECATGGCPVYAIYSTIDANDVRVECQRLLLPFGGEDGKVEQMLASLQLTVVDTRKRILTHFGMQADVLLIGRIKPGFTLPEAEPATTVGKTGKDERRAARRNIKRTARLSFARQNLVCTVRNVSATGASIQVANVDTIPDSFQLVMEMETAARRCVVVWRKATQIGVKFT